MNSILGNLLLKVPSPYPKLLCSIIVHSKITMPTAPNDHVSAIHGGRMQECLATKHQ